MQCTKCDNKDQEICALCGGVEAPTTYEKMYKVTGLWEIPVRSTSQAIVKIVVRSLFDAGDPITATLTMDVLNDISLDRQYTLAQVTLCMQDLVSYGILTD